MTDSPSPYSKPAPGPSRRTSPPRRAVRRRQSWLDRLMAKPEPRRRPGRSRAVPAPSSTPSRSSRSAPAPRRSDRSRRNPSWPPRPPRRVPALPAAPRPVLIAIRTLVIGVGIAAITGTLLSMLTPADMPGATATSASRSESAITARSGSDNTLGLSRELTPLKTELEALPELTPGLTATLFWLDLDTGEYVNIDGQAAVAAASTIKLPVLLALFEDIDAGRVTVEQTLVVQPEQVAGGSGNFQNQPQENQYTVLEVATQMIINSDNTATNMVIDLLGGADALNTRFQSWGLTSTVINNPLPDLEGTNTTSPRDLVKVMAMVNQGEVLSLRSRDRVLNILQRTYNKNLLVAGVEQEALTYNKTGDIGSLLGDVALVDLPNGKRYAIAALVQRPENDGRARELIRRFSQTVYQAMQREIEPVQQPDAAAPDPLPSAAPGAASEIAPEIAPDPAPPSTN